MLATGQHGDETRALLDKYSDLRNGSTEEAVESWRLTIEDFEDDNSVRIPIAPASLNNYIGGGVLRGHNITVYGRPDSGKSMFALNCAAALVRAGHRVLYVANEEPARDITLRLLARLCDIDVGELRDHDTLAQALEYCAPQYAGWHLLHRAGITIDGIRAAADKIKPDVIVVDQLKNVAVNDDNRALQLDKLARQVRELGIEFDAVTISVTQAGESAHNRLVLGLGDVEWSNTGIPGAADLMIGIGVDDLYDSEGKRMISLPKNKVNGKHGAFPVWVNPKRTAFMSKREG
jgi:KaiC/GvpD/RAD55 family RecA-like ATPase